MECTFVPFDDFDKEFDFQSCCRDALECLMGWPGVGDWWVKNSEFWWFNKGLGFFR
jgi:hypothetical protein